MSNNYSEIFQHNYSDLVTEYDKGVWMLEFRKLSQQVYETHDIKSQGNVINIIKKTLPLKYTHIFVTVNPPPSLLLDDFIKIINKMLNKRWIKGYIYVLEQRGENDEELGKGFHTHILLDIQEGIKKSEIDREIKNTWKKILDQDNYHILNIKYINNDEQLRKQSYMLSYKKEEIKHKKQEYDIIWRNRNNLNKYYYLNYKIEQTCQENMPDL
jgi:hypothetical protein|uniref:Uncharacterized protein n=1 Tax=Pygoscelis antarcticus TaxID=79643 RepID=A0A7G7LKK8_PYGAN|nr:hypothetical protein [Pygoscelis antarcticus]QNG41021.1 hypothetical protein [Pygoscelis antarcticus]QNG41025.1 hypothetical protein [Pygoscelis antarcticus]QNG41027.1 hypothetical protein [Pygoscelis antarcticus]QNG41029.1 hypothetical protein [Pygoscelis antarcticus]